ncbi:glucose/mannose transport system substrate-binding protein [Undibacterium sp. GrIS 1.8]|uniref:ABC transporter substrate-binding protein n=1 Tax=unclassified Undibacterium TaxID=2630295 RepID=UPI003390AFFA
MQTVKIRLLPHAECARRYQLSSQQIVRNLILPILLLVTSSTTWAETLQVLHWWKSASEHKAVDVLASKLAQENIIWRDALIPSGSGIGAGIVLKSRILTGNAPEVSQVNGVLISEWSDLGLLLDFDAVGAAGKWDKVLFPLVWTLVQPKGRLVAAPLGIHRINTLFINRKVFKKYDLKPPETWDEFEVVAKKLKQAGVIPLAQSSEPWQVATLFENLVLSEAGAGFYNELFVKKDVEAFSDARFANALKRLRALKKMMSVSSQERTWVEMARQFADGNAAMFIMGDWAKAELNYWGLATDVGFSCMAVPGTENYHLYDIDTLVMLTLDGSHRAAQEKLAQIVVSPALQTEYNRVKGSISVLRNQDSSKMDSCSRASLKAFSVGSAAQVPSFAHRMATDEISKDAIIAEIVRFFIDDKMSIGDTQRRLAAIARSLPKT